MFSAAGSVEVLRIHAPYESFLAPPRQLEGDNQWSHEHDSAAKKAQKEKKCAFPHIQHR
jgi:hypothetical protein